MARLPAAPARRAQRRRAQSTVCGTPAAAAADVGQSWRGCGRVSCGADVGQSWRRCGRVSPGADVAMEVSPGAKCAPVRRSWRRCGADVTIRRRAAHRRQSRRRPLLTEHGVGRERAVHVHVAAHSDAIANSVRITACACAQCHGERRRQTDRIVNGSGRILSS